MHFGEDDTSPLAGIGQVADRLELLVQVCRLIALRVGTAEIAEEILELATWIYNEVDHLRIAIAKLPG